MTSDQPKVNRRNFLFAASTLAALAPFDPVFCRAALRESLQADTDPAPGSAAATRSIYSIRQLSEQELLETYQQLLADACANAAAEWKSAAFGSQAGFWGDGASSGNGGIRTVVSMLLACSTLIRYGDRVEHAVRSDLASKSLAAMRYTTATHRTGSAKCSDGKQWGATPGFGSESWQSGMWTGTLAWASWLIWDRLDAELQLSLQRVIAWECDVLSRRPPPNGLWLDTKAEENGWEVPCLVNGALMFPSHPHASEWQQTACSYMMNTLCTEADARDSSLVDGRPVNEWIKGANLQPDFTLENHNIFHPVYVACSCYFLTQAIMYYTYGGRRIPQSATHHLLDTWRMFQTILLPWGEAACPQGMDWELHALPFINLYASLATHWHDPLAAHLEQCCLQYLRAWQVACHGSLATPGSPLGFVRHAINAEQASYGFLAHQIFGSAVRPLSAHDAAVLELGVHDYPYVDFIVHRSEKKFASFSWKNKIMGLLIPLGDGHKGNPDFAVPIQNGFVGSFEVDPAGDTKEDKKITVIEHDRRKTDDGFETSGTILLHGGRLQQKIKMTSIGSQAVIYEDEVTALADVTVKKELGIPVGIENDQITGGIRTVTGKAGATSVDFRRPQKFLNIPGSWVNVDDRLGVVMLDGARICYAPATAYSPGIAVSTDILYGVFNDVNRQFNPSETVAHRLAIVLSEVTPEETSAVHLSSRIEDKPDGRTLYFKQPGGKQTAIALLPTGISKL